MFGFKHRSIFSLFVFTIFMHVTQKVLPNIYIYIYNGWIEGTPFFFANFHSLTTFFY